MSGKIASESWISHMSNKVKSGGGINLAQGIPGFDPPEDLLHTLKDMSLDKVHQYPPGNGQQELVSQICNSYNDQDDITQDEVLVLQGATEGVTLVYTYLNNILGKGWNSLAFDPVYESYREIPKIFNNELFSIPLKKGGFLDKAIIEQSVINNNVKLVFINTPGNPLGKVWSEAEFEWVFELAEKHNFFILLDAVYKDLYFFENRPFLPLSFNRERLFYINSFSKMLSITGWRVGYLISDKKTMLKLRAIHDYTGLCAPSILQYAISDYLANSNYASDYVSSVRVRLSQNYSRAKKILENMGFYVENAGGGYFIWCRLPDEQLTGVDFALQLYDKKKVGLVPGIHFSDKAKFWLRINIARSSEELDDGLASIASFMQ